MYSYIQKYLTSKVQKNDYIRFAEIVAAGVFASLLISKFIWIGNEGAIHSVLELLCIIFNMSLFLIVWNKYDSNPSSSRIIALGLLSASIFYTLHIYFSRFLGLATGEYINLGAMFWILGRFTEVIAIFLASFNLKRSKLSKRINLSIAIIYPLVASYLSIIYINVWPVLYNRMGLTDNKVMLELIIMVLALISLLRHRDKIDERGYISYKCLATAIMIIVPTEICLMIYKSYDSSIFVCGHVLKVIYCYFLYRSIFKSSVDYPYEEMEYSRKRLNDILDALPIGILTYDNSLRLDFVNKQFEKLMSCEREDILGLTNRELLNIFTVVDDKNVVPLAERVIQGEGNTKKVIRTYTNMQGKPVKVQTDAEKIDDGVIFVIKDARNEQEVENLHIQTRTILNSMKNAAFICDSQSNIIDTNETFEKIIGMSNNKVKGINILQLSELLNNEKRVVSVNDCDIDTDKQFEVAISNKDGGKTEFIVQRSKIFNLYKEVIGEICICTDVTELKEQQKKILHQEKLALLGQMGATIVHETRNFLTTIKGCGQLIEVFSEESRIVEYARKINMNVDEVNRIISDFLSLAKPKEAVLEEIAVCDLMKSMESIIETSSLIKGVEIRFIYNVDERYILCDESQLRQVILNLCKNAIEAMAEVQKPVLIVETGVDEESNSVYIKVSDNGKGMSKETLDKIGTPFFTTKQGGTGLGLSVCYDMINGQGGWIDVFSKEKEGTTFTINLPGIEDDVLEDDIELLPQMASSVY